LRYLVISDVHSNLEALEAVLEDSKGQYERIVCCGDLAGYGPDPNAVIDWSRANLSAVIRGNHDRACAGIDSLEWFNPIAQTATRWTMAQLTPENLEYLRSLPAGPLAMENFLLAHGSPLDEDEYLISVTDAADVLRHMETNLAFFGHTHLQSGFGLRGGKQYLLSRAVNHEKWLRVEEDSAWLVNPGSVGQPRDGDARAAYALFESETNEVLLRRVAYDSEQTRRKIEAAGLPPVLGHRLAIGR
jgi:diadenosine tetraphosphatase ApaH/serine/threonine PP2A family protein phosphatase